MPPPQEDEYKVLQALSEQGAPLDTFNVYRGDRRVSSHLTPQQVRAFFERKTSRPVRDESRMGRCPLCNVAMPPDTPRHVQTPDGQVTRGHHLVRDAAKEPPDGAAQAPGPEYNVLQAHSDAGDPLAVFNIFRGDRRLSSNLTPEQVRAFFEHNAAHPVRDESRMQRCPICHVAMPPDSPRHVQTPDGQVTRGHRLVRLHP